MIFDHPSLNARSLDQAEGLRELRRIDPAHPTRLEVLPWPRVILVSECPASDIGARFAFHLVRALSQSTVSSSAAGNAAYRGDQQPAERPLNRDRSGANLQPTVSVHDRLSQESLHGSAHGSALHASAHGSALHASAHNAGQAQSKDELSGPARNAHESPAHKTSEQSRLGQSATGQAASAGQQNLLIDLSPAASRLPHVLADWIPANSYHPLWSQLASGRALWPNAVNEPAPLSRRSSFSGDSKLSRCTFAVAAEAQPTPCAVEQLPRLYEQLVRQLSRQPDRYRWIVLLAADSIVPIDRACWQAADDVVLLAGSEPTAGQRQLAIVRNRIDAEQPERTLWTMPKRRPGLMGLLASRGLIRSTGTMLNGAATSAVPDAGLLHGSSTNSRVELASKLLPSIRWPERCDEYQLRDGSRVDSILAAGAREIADKLRLSAACPECDELANRNDTNKKIQLGRHVRPISGVTEEFRA